MLKLRMVAMTMMTTMKMTIAMKLRVMVATTTKAVMVVMTVMVTVMGMEIVNSSRSVLLLLLQPRPPLTTLGAPRGRVTPPGARETQSTHL